MLPRKREFSENIASMKFVINGYAQVTVDDDRVWWSLSLFRPFANTDGSYRHRYYMTQCKTLVMVRVKRKSDAKMSQVSWSVNSALPRMKFLHEVVFVNEETISVM